MSKNSDTIKNIFPGPEISWKRNVLIGLGIFLVLAILADTGALVYHSFYDGKIFPGVYVGQHSLGGMTEQQAKDFIENFNNKITKESLDLNFSTATTSNTKTQSKNFKFSVVSTDDSSVEMIRINSDSSAAKLMSVGRTGTFWQQIWQPLYFRFISSRKVPVDVVMDDKFITSLQNYMAAFSEQPSNANIKITNLMPLEYTVVPERYGVVFDYDRLKNDLQSNLSSLSLTPIEIYRKDFRPEVLTGDLEPLFSKLPNILNYGDLGLNFIDPQTKGRRDWSIGPTLYTDWLEVRREKGDLVFALSKEKVVAYLETIRPYIDIPVQNTRYVLEGNKVKEFQGSQSGISLNLDNTYNSLDSLFRERNFAPVEVAKTVTVSVDTIKPNATASPDVNNLDEMQVLGVGYSTFKDSHTNRIKNIANAVKRLDGILIKPGEEFSANKYAGPYTSEEGFLPEMVIKGNKIIPEIGGGMCQIGTTLFRMAMNSGMPISERRNHSLVVGYYADPVNGNPGTDATLYEPSVDFKFINDTGGYLLLQTAIDYTKQQLVFTLWGKSDGRSGSYTHPKVTKWIPSGEPQQVIVSDLKPGETKCQNAFRGAVASFTYTRFTSTSEKIDRVFDSYYRPLPKICMVGASASTSSTPIGEVAAP
ncbi:MAG: VanW family protein [Parcubacteria group bacterium Gr01-1014_13]|nr:MAG: VanW family protein [Parcubacteria group bacterium Gr01-1014_13]